MNYEFGGKSEISPAPKSVRMEIAQNGKEH
jgi:hypothetical protein